MVNANAVAAPAKLTHIAKKDRHCSKCGGTIKAGEQYRQARERALSYNEAVHAGTMYPTRRICGRCA
jgi:ribosomal protein S27AE